MGYLRLPLESARRLCGAIFESYGFSPDQAREITGVLLAADLNGIESHGLSRLVRYDREINSGFVDIHAQPQTVFETPISAVIDARKSMGQLVSCHGMRMAVEKARKSGAGMVAVRNSNHYGIAGYYARMACEADLMGICMTNSEAILVPTFARAAMLGTNPIALAMPADPIDFVFDAATSVVPLGRLEVFNKRGQPLPEGWALDAEGLDTRDAAEVIANICGRKGGGIVPLGGSDETGGGHKGYGFALICELMTAILSSGLTSDEVNVTPGVNGMSHCFIAMDYGLFGDKQAIRAHFSNYLSKLRSAAKARGQDRVYTHGEKEYYARERIAAEGIPVNQVTLSEMLKIASSRGVDTGFLAEVLKEAP